MNLRNQRTVLTKGTNGGGVQVWLTHPLGDKCTRAVASQVHCVSGMGHSPKED